MARDIDVDVAKGICIILVVVRHMEVFYKICVIPFTYIAVPLFFFMSGFYVRNDGKFLDFFANNVKKIIIPAIIWAILSLCYNIPLQCLNKGYYNIEFDWVSPIPTNGPLWFLFALFYAKMIFFFLDRIRITAVIIVSSLVIGYLGVNYEMPCFLNEGFAAVPFLIAGKLCYRHLNYLRDNIYLVLLGVLSYILFVSKTLEFDIIPISVNQYKPYYVVCVLGVMLSFLPFLKMTHYLKSGLLSQIGLHTMGILCIHVQICHSFAVVVRKLMLFGSDGWICLSLVAFVLVVIISYYITIFLEKEIPFVFGKF